MTNSIQLDFSHEMTFGDLADFIEPFELQAKIIELVGPGGGNPLIELSGTYENIVSYLEEYTDGTDEDIKFFVEQIVKKAQ